MGKGGYLSDQAVQVGVSRALDVQRAAADVVDSLVVEHHSNVGVLEQGVSGEHAVVGLNHSSGHLCTSIFISYRANEVCRLQCRTGWELGSINLDMKFDYIVKLMKT